MQYLIYLRLEDIVIKVSTFIRSQPRRARVARFKPRLVLPRRSVPKTWLTANHGGSDKHEIMNIKLFYQAQ